ncbi:hypothetical protein BG005_007383 [Podila minutissima]|nr:hypothetical protein BG005_007383 [Podila minutissima]
MDSFKAFSQQLNPLAAKLSKQYSQAKQFAQEKMGTAEDITELPQEYKDLEKRFDAVQKMHTNLLRITKTYQTQTYDYPAQLQETLSEYGRSVSERISQATLSPAEKAAADAAALEDPHRRENAHPVARPSAEDIGLEEPMGSALFKYATVQEKVGDMRLVMDQEITDKFVTPFGTTMNNQIQAAVKARRSVYSTRLALDTAKAQYRNTRPERAEASKVEVEQAEDLFVAALEETMALMKIVLETPEPLRNLADMVAAQLAFYKDAYEILNDVAPEIDSLQVTQEALYRNSRSE